jgi:hypothetical protein
MTSHSCIAQQNGGGNFLGRQIYRAYKSKIIIFTYDYTVFIQTRPTFEEMTSIAKLSLLSLIPESYVNENSMNDFHCMTKGGVFPEM